MILIWVLVVLFLAFGFVVFFGAPYVPAKIKHVQAAFDELYHLKKSDVLLDLGSGDGKILREAASRGAGAVGYELNPLLVWLSRFLSRRYRAVTIKLANIWSTPFPQDVTVIYVFGDTRDIKRIAKKIQKEATRLKRPLHVLSYGFELPRATLVDRNTMHYLYKISPLQIKKP